MNKTRVRGLLTLIHLRTMILLLAHQIDNKGL
nr:MAG TPA: hypothetical protein [Caudoviricetes sp.]